MSARLLIVDSVATNRILMRSVLKSAHYDVTVCASMIEGCQSISDTRPDLALIDIAADPAGAVAVIMALRADAALAGLPILALSDRCTPAARTEALKAGADDVVDKTAPEALILARIRAHLRARSAASEYDLPGEAAFAGGFADAAEGFVPAGRVGVLSAVPRGAAATFDTLDRLLDRLPGPADWVTADIGSVREGAGGHDLYILDGQSGAAHLRRSPATLFRDLADLRSRPDTRHATTLVVLPRAASEDAAMALDLGADDVVHDDVSVEELAWRVRMLLRRKSVSDRLRHRVQSRLHAAMTDPLTGLFNRRYALPQLERMGEQARATGRDFAVMVLDIDHFKSINDSYGHTAGDRVLIEVGRRLRDNLRAVDLVARIGGEEFLVAMPDTTADKARNAAERLRRVMAGTPFETGTGAGGPPSRIDVTLSIGVAVGLPRLGEAEGLGALFDRADAALYEAKTAGRNTVSLARTAA